MTQQTRLGNYGGPRTVYGSFAGKVESVAPENNRIDTLGKFRSSITTGEFSGAETRGEFKTGRTTGTMK